MAGSPPDFQKIFRDSLIKTAVGVGVLLVLIGILVFFFEEEIEGLAGLIYSQFGFWGLATALFITDCFVTPFPPDLILLIISKSSLKENWFYHVTLLGIISTVAGFTGAYIGRWLSNRKWAQKIKTRIDGLNSTKLEKFGFFGIMLGALTPVPFSVTCWAAGFVGMSRRLIFLGCLLRIPRFWVYYWLIASSGWLSGYIQNLFF